MFNGIQVIGFVFVAPLSRDEIGIIPCPEARYNRSPIVLVENKLGVESWCVKFLLPYVHNKLLLYRQRKHWLDRDGRSTQQNPQLCAPWLLSPSWLSTEQTLEWLQVCSDTRMLLHSN